MTVPAIQQFTPTGVQTFGLIDPTAQNASFAAIAATFAAQSALTIVTANTQLTSTLRNVLVDVTLFGDGLTLVVKLPVNPSVGDPPCIVEMLVSGYRLTTNCYVTTSDGNSINSIVPDNVNKNNQPSLWMAGDKIYFVFIGGAVGWLAIGTFSAVDDLTIFLPGTIGAFPWMGQVVVDENSSTISVEGLQSLGASATFISINGSNIGTSTSTFNGTPGPLFVGALVQAKVTNVGTRAFTVTT